MSQSRSLSVLVAAVAIGITGCATQDIPQAHRGRLFGRTGMLSFYSGASGPTGPVLNPGTHFLGTYNEMRMVDCSMTTIREPLDTLTHDGVHFGFDIVTRFSADCSDEGVLKLLGALTPKDPDGSTITAQQIYDVYVKPAIGEASRESVSPLRANELNEKQAEVAEGVKKRFTDIMSKRERRSVVIHEVNISHLQFPQALDSANLERAAQSVLRDKAIAERERVSAEVETMTVRRKLAEQEAEVAVVKIEKVGAALRKNPEYMQYDLQLKLPDIYREAGQHGNLVLAAPNPFSFAQSNPRTTPPPAPPPTNR